MDSWFDNWQRKTAAAGMKPLQCLSVHYVTEGNRNVLYRFTQYPTLHNWQFAYSSLCLERPRKGSPENQDLSEICKWLSKDNDLTLWIQVFWDVTQCYYVPPDVSGKRRAFISKDHAVQQEKDTESRLRRTEPRQHRLQDIESRNFWFALSLQVRILSEYQQRY